MKLKPTGYKATRLTEFIRLIPIPMHRFETISYQEVLEKQLKVMNASAISLCMENNLPIMVLI